VIEMSVDSLLAPARRAYVPSVPLSDKRFTVPVVRSGVGAGRPVRVSTVLLAGDVVQVPAVAQLDPAARAVVLVVTDVRLTRWPGVVELSGVDRDAEMAGLTVWARLAHVVPVRTALGGAS
jgi:hypothetical protein